MQRDVTNSYRTSSFVIRQVTIGFYNVRRKNSRLVLGRTDRLLETENEGIIDELILLNSVHVGKIKYQESYWERLNVEKGGEVEWNKEVRREAGNEVACIFFYF